MQSIAERFPDAERLLVVLWLWKADAQVDRILL
jgi:hypothetical protein